jgi:DNA invertase Pin-like site-specific DNA recombinase
MNVVAYIRVSTKGQGESGLGLEAQRQYIEQAARSSGWNVVGEYVEVVSGSVAPLQRPEFSKAAAHNLPVIAAKLDRISRDVEHIAALMKRVQFKVATMPHADTFQLHLFAALAEQERQFIRSRTKEALEALKGRADAGDSDSIAKVGRRAVALAKGRTIDNQRKGGATTAKKSQAFAQHMEAHIHHAIAKGSTSLRSVASFLNSRDIKTATGSSWQATSVKRVMETLSIAF